VPRDVFVPNARIDGANKIDAALYNGPSQLVAAIKRTRHSDQPLRRIEFRHVADVVNVLGGIKMYFPMEVFDAYSGLYVRHPGCIQLNELARCRSCGSPFADTLSRRRHGLSHVASRALSDLARIRRDHEF